MDDERDIPCDTPEVDAVLTPAINYASFKNLLGKARQLERQRDQLRLRDCITRVGKGGDDRIFVVYLSDGKKIVLGRDATTHGPAWLEVQEQSHLKPM